MKVETAVPSLFRDHRTLVLCGIAFATCLPYVARLGFYNDDWALLAAYQNAPGQNLWSMMLADGERMRPVRVAYSAVLYWLFGLSPLGYHLTNALVLAVSCGLLHRLLRTIGVPANDALAIALVWVTLPHAATGRFWYAIFQMQASLGIMFAAALAELQFLDRRRWRWRIVALLGIGVSALLYEVALPLFLLIPVLAVACALRRGRPVPGPDKLWLTVYPASVALLVAMKLATATRLEAATAAAFGPWLLANLKSMIEFQDDSVLWGFNIWRALRIAFVDLGVGLWRYVAESVRSLGLGVDLAAAAAVTAAAFMLVFQSGAAERASARRGATYVATGFGLFLLGWSVFLGSASLQLSATGIGNRTGGAAAIGVAFVYVGLLEWIASQAPRFVGRSLFAILIASIVGANSLLIYRIADDWAAAWDREQEILSQIGERFPDGFSGRSLILDGVCQYIGPATVFEASWDLEWALQVKYADPSIRADVVTPTIEIRPDALRTALYGEEKLYKYGSVVMYHPASGQADVIDDASEAERFLNARDPDRSGGCEQGQVGHGVDILHDREAVTYLAGFYQPEGNAAWRWMAEQGTVSLANQRRDMTLTVKGRVPEQIVPAPTVQVLLNGQSLDTIDSARLVDRHYDVPASAQGTGESVALQLTTDRTFVPADVMPGSADRRRLGFILETIAWSGLSDGDALLQATPNLLQRGPNPGTTVVDWNARDASGAVVRVSVNGGEERLFATGVSGSATADWINAADRYRFTLYRGGTESQEPLASVVVEWAKPGLFARRSALRVISGLVVLLLLFYYWRINFGDRNAGGA